MKKIFIIVGLTLLLGAGCRTDINTHPVPTPQDGKNSVPTSTRTVEPPPEVGASSTITYYVSTSPDARVTYCGGPTDSAGYKKTLTVEVSRALNRQFTGEEKIKKTLEMAVNDTDFWNSPYTRIASTTFENGVVTMRPAGGFAGVSLFMCGWKPFVEKQLEQFPEIGEVDGIKKINWEPVS